MKKGEGPDQQQAAHQQNAVDEGSRENRGLRVPGRPGHDPRLLGLKGQHQAQETRGSHIDPENLQGQNGQGNAEQNGGNDDQPLTQVGGQGPDNELCQVVEDAAPLFNRGLNGAEIVVDKHHVGGILGHLGAGYPHGHADIRLFQGRGIIDAVAGHGHHVTSGLQGLHQAQFLVRRHPGEHRCFLDLFD
ncbi:hypothetical protein BMS3Abin13_01568 [bacterium BMS3Abin13]|nr:hypothetical protein BMS3Abin13_01568 [bacterium BMS3Abin13]